MKRLASLIILIFVSQIVFGQNREKAYKTFSDTIFESGDLILCPALIYYTWQEVGPRDSLKKFADFLNSFPNMVVEIGVHTDIRGDISYNDTLSYVRAKTLMYALINDYGIESDRITCRGYGERMNFIPEFVIDKAEGKKLKEYLHSLNRRITLRVLEV